MAPQASACGAFLYNRGTMHCDIPYQNLSGEANAQFLDQMRERVRAEFPKLFVRLRPVEAGENDEVTVVTPAAEIAPGTAAPVMSMADVAEHTRIKERLTEIRDQLLRELRES